MRYEMNNMKRIFLTTLALLTLALGATAAWAADTPDPENTLYMDLKDGRVVIEMYPDLAPKHVARIKELVRQGFYDGLTFHRVIEGFMAQTGCPQGNGTGGSGQKIKSEFNNHRHYRGVCSMARARDVDSADSQFFIMYDKAPHLDRQYTVWGKVIKGMEYVDMIKKGNPHANGAVTNPDHIIRMQVAADVEQ